MKILLAEDDPVSRTALEATLQQWGYEVIPVVDGKKALRILTEPVDPPRLAILDWMMPWFDGVDVCRAVRAAQLPITPYLLLLTARTSRDDVVIGLRAGADDYVTKPFDRLELQVRLQVGVRVVRLQTQLVERVRELEEGRRRERALRGLLPICAYCRKIRDDRNYWKDVEQYVESAGVQFTHGVCPDCVGRVEEELAVLKRTATAKPDE